jgi:hypothetical protein
VIARDRVIGKGKSLPRIYADDRGSKDRVGLSALNDGRTLSLEVGPKEEKARGRETCYLNRLSAQRKNPSRHVGKRGAFG